MTKTSIFFAIMFFLADICAAAQSDNIQLMLLTGRSSKAHSWQATTKAVQQHLADAGIFSVDTYTASPAGEPLDDFDPDWEAYDSIVMIYEGEEWPEAVQKKFEKYMKKGGGLVLVHAADNAFPQWREFNKMIGVGGWGSSDFHLPPLSLADNPAKKDNRDERWGPRVYWQHGQAVRDASPGKASHPPRQQFIVTVRDYSHPVTRGLPEMWLHMDDEIYSNLRGPAKNMHILATAFANPALGKPSPYNEPIIFTVRYGKGRVFHMTLGHVGRKQDHTVPAVNDVAFITLLQRGAEWSATGEVTQAVPKDFPNVYKGALREPATEK